MFRVSPPRVRPRHPVSEDVLLDLLGSHQAAVDQHVLKGRDGGGRVMVVVRRDGGDDPELMVASRRAVRG